MEIIDKMVEFEKYCINCKHKNVPGHKDPCHECLDNPTNVGSIQPVKYEKEETKKKD